MIPKIDVQSDLISAIETCREIESIYEQLSQMSSLAPSETVDHLFSRLVNLAVTEKYELVEHILSDLRIKAIQPNLHNICSVGEYCLELHWVRQILGNAKQMLLRFTYYENYQKLTQLEYYSIQAVSYHPIQKVLFIGSGPLPLSSIILAQQYGLMIDNLDLDQEAYQLSRALIHEMNLETQLYFFHSNILSYEQIEQYDVIYLAALVGQTHRDKKKIIQHIAQHMMPNGLLILRSASRLKKLLYPPIDISDLSDFHVLTEVHPYNEIVNSLIIAKKI